MKKRNLYQYDYKINYQRSLMNRITVNKNSNICNKTLRLYNCKRINNKINNDIGNLYYEKDFKILRDKNQILVNKNKKNKLSEDKNIIKNNNQIRNYNQEPYKKTINTYSNENRYKDRNIFEELQNNRYLKPMLVTSNINNKLLKCKIEEPIKNINSLSLRNYFTNIELPFQKCQSPQKPLNEIYEEDKIYAYNLNNRTVMDKFSVNTNNDNSPTSAMTTKCGKNNSNSFMYNNGDYYNLNNFLLRYSVNNIKKYCSNHSGGKENEKYFYYEEKEEKTDNISKYGSPRVYHKNSIALRSPFLNNIIKSNINDSNNNKLNKNNYRQRDKMLLQVYRNKLIEEFIKIFKKFILRYYKKIGRIFLKKLLNFKNTIKIYFRKKNSRLNIKKLSLIEKNYNVKLQIQKNISKINFDSISNFNSKSFSNEFKSTSLSNNMRVNCNNKFYKQNASFVLSEQKLKKYYQSPEDSLNKYQISHVRKKVIVPKKRGSGSQYKVITKSPSQFEGRDSGGEIFIYKKKNLNNDNLYINKNVKNNEINNNKKGKIINIDINLGKPINIINDHSSFQEYIIESPKLLRLNSISSKNINLNLNLNKKRRHKARSGSKNKTKPPLIIKKFLEEDDDEFIHNNNFDKDYIRANSSVKKDKDNIINTYLEEKNKNKNFNIDEDIKVESIENNNKYGKLFINFNYFSFLNNKIKKTSDNTFKYLIIEKTISMLLKNQEKDKNGKIKNNSHFSKNKVKTIKTNKLLINCTKYLEKIYKKIIKKKVFIILSKCSKK